MPSLILPILTFSLLLLPYLGTIPYLDGNSGFLISMNLFHGNYFTSWINDHGPLKSLILSLSFYIFGLSALTYNLIGYILGLTGIYAIYTTTKNLFDKKIALISALLLATSGLYLATAIFSLLDFIITVAILISFTFYTKRKYLLSAIASTCAVLTKETAIFWAVSILIVELSQKKFRFINLLPLLTLGAWIAFVNLTGHTLWNSYNFSPTAKQGSAYTIINNILTGNLFNQYAYQNWMHLFIFNFNWIFWILTLLSLQKIKWNQNLSIISTFIFLYTTLVLSFQTFTITRYILPILPFLYILTAVQLHHTKYKPLIIPIVFLCISLSLFTSSDPISSQIWTKQQKLNEQFYTHKLDGRDGITYNLQFLSLAKKRSDLIKTSQCKQYKDQLDIDPEVEQTLKYFNLPPCH